MPLHSQHHTCPLISPCNTAVVRNPRRQQRHVRTRAMRSNTAHAHQVWSINIYHALAHVPHAVHYSHCCTVACRSVCAIRDAGSGYHRRSRPGNIPWGTLYKRDIRPRQRGLMRAGIFHATASASYHPLEDDTSSLLTDWTVLREKYGCT